MGAGELAETALQRTKFWTMPPSRSKFLTRHPQHVSWSSGGGGSEKGQDLKDISGLPVCWFCGQETAKAKAEPSSTRRRLGVSDECLQGMNHVRVAVPWSVIKTDEPNYLSRPPRPEDELPSSFEYASILESKTPCWSSRGKDYSRLMRELSQFKAEFFEALAHPLCLRALHAARDGEVAVNELSLQPGVGQSTLSHQLAILRNRSIIRGRKNGSNVLCSVRDPAIFRPLHAAKETFSHHLIEFKDPLSQLHRTAASG